MNSTTLIPKCSSCIVFKPTLALPNRSTTIPYGAFTTNSTESYASTPRVIDRPRRTHLDAPLLSQLAQLNHALLIGRMSRPTHKHELDSRSTLVRISLEQDRKRFNLLPMLLLRSGLSPALTTGDV